MPYLFAAGQKHSKALSPIIPGKPFDKSHIIEHGKCLVQQTQSNTLNSEFIMIARIYTYTWHTIYTNILYYYNIEKFLGKKKERNCYSFQMITTSPCIWISDIYYECLPIRIQIVERKKRGAIKRKFRQTLIFLSFFVPFSGSVHLHMNVMNRNVEHREHCARFDKYPLTISKLTATIQIHSHR